MGAKNLKVLQRVKGLEAVELILQCIFIGFWQFIKSSVNNFWKGHRRKLSKALPQVEVSVDSSVGTHCYIKVMGVKYHYVSTGPKTGQVVLILGDAPDKGNMWCLNWTQVVQTLAENGHHVITLDLRGTGGSESGGRADLSPPNAVDELASLMKALGVSDSMPAYVVGFGVGGMLTWYLVHCYGSKVSKFAVIGAPHPDLYWSHPPAAFCKGVLHFIQWPYFPERLLAERARRGAAGRWASSRARDWAGALNYVRGIAWWRIRKSHVAGGRALLVGHSARAVELVASAARCVSPTLRLLDSPDPSDPHLSNIILQFLIDKDKTSEDEPRGLMTRVLGAMAGRGRELSARLASLPS